jgi:hypothetical protein
MLGTARCFGCGWSGPISATERDADGGHHCWKCGSLVRVAVDPVSRQDAVKHQGLVARAGAQATLQRDLLETLNKDYKALMAAERTPTYYGAQSRDDARVEARQTLQQSLDNARETIARVQGTQAPELRPLLAQLVVQTELADDTMKHPELLRR